jgi:hypothetical protein
MSSVKFYIALIIGIPATSIVMGIVIVCLAQQSPDFSQSSNQALNKTSWKAP